jgi:peptidoglycan hydrolase FlgJ
MTTSPVLAAPVSAALSTMPMRVARPAAVADDAKIWAAAHKFEAMAIGELLKPMFDTVDLASSPFGGGAAEQAWQPMLVDAMAQQMGKAGGFGLASAIHDALLQQQEQAEK